MSTSTQSSTQSAAAVSPARLGGGGAILLAASLWGTTGTVRTFAPASAGSVSVGAARILIGGLLLFALAVRSGGLRALLASRRNAALVALGAVNAALYQCAFFAAVARTGVATGTVVTIGSAPAFAGLLMRSGIDRRWLIATAGAVLGCAALIGGGQEAGVEPVGVTLALVSGFGYAVYATISSHLIVKGHDDRAVIGSVFGGAAVLLLPVLLLSSPGWLLSASGLLVAVYLGAVTTTVGYALYARGLRRTPVAVATTLGLAEPAVAAVLGLVVLDEHLGAIALGGLALVAAGIVLLVVPRRG